MDDRIRKLASLRETLTPDWGEARSELAWLGVSRLQRRARTLRIAAVSGGGVLGALGLLLVLAPWQWQGQGQGQGQASGTGSPRNEPAGTPLLGVAAPDPSANGFAAPIQFADGSRATLAAADSRLALERNEPGTVRLRLDSGAAHFEVVPNARREFSVVAGSVQVVVVGTAFDVERTEHRVRVRVNHGKVRVQSPLGEAFVEAGESRWFEQASPPQKPETARKPASSALRKDAAQTNWRSLNQSGDHEGAYALLEKGASVENDAQVLMEAADAARLTGHLDAAVSYLRKVVAQHRSNPVTPLAAFTLGRMLLGQLGRPAEAAEAFATARELAPEGSMSQDALAREVEAWSKAGQSSEAFQRARLFVERYPQSRRRRVVELYGGLSTP